MTIRLTAAIVIATQCFVACAVAQTPAATPAPSASLRPPPDAPPVKENPPGSYAVTIESDPGLPTHTIYRPADLASFVGGKKLPIISWGNGACANAGTLFKVFLSDPKMRPCPHLRPALARIPERRLRRMPQRPRVHRQFRRR
jgi:hypothetical protein